MAAALLMIRICVVRVCTTVKLDRRVGMRWNIPLLQPRHSGRPDRLEAFVGLVVVALMGGEAEMSSAVIHQRALAARPNVARKLGPILELPRATRVRGDPRCSRLNVPNLTFAVLPQSRALPGCQARVNEVFRPKFPSRQS